MKPLNQIVIATDFSKDSDTAVLLGKQLSESCGGKVTLIHVSDVTPVWDWPSTEAQATQLLGHFQKEIQDALEKKMQDQLRRCGVGYSGIVKFGNSQQVLLDFLASQSADLLVLGHRGETNLLRLGSFAQKMIAQAPIPVLVAKQNSPLRTLGCLVDPANFSAKAIDVTASLAAQLSATKKFVSFVADLSSDALMNIPFVMPSYKFSADEKIEIIEKASAFIIERAPSIARADVHIEISTLPTAKALAQALTTQHVNLAIVTRHHRGAIEKFFIGSVSKGILEEFAGNILVLPE